MLVTGHRVGFNFLAHGFNFLIFFDNRLCKNTTGHLEMDIFKDGRCFIFLLFHIVHNYLFEYFHILH